MMKAKKFKQVRRTLRQNLAKSIGRNNVIQHVKPGEKIALKSILVCRPNHRLGNLLLVTPLLQEITHHFPDCKIDLFVKAGVAPVLFKNFSSVDKLVQIPKKPLREIFKYLVGWSKIKKHSYDLVMNIDKGSSSG